MGRRLRTLIFLLICAPAAALLPACEGSGPQPAPAETLAPRDAYNQLAARSQNMYRLNSLAILADWDQEVFMPPAGNDYRAQASSYCHQLVHDMLVDPQFGACLAAAEKGDPAQWSPTEAANLRLWRRMLDQQNKLPADYVARESRASSEAYAAWMEARDKDDFSIFEPHLEEIISLNREKAGTLGYAEHPYDALLDLWEPGLTTAQCQNLFDRMKPFIMDLLARIQASGLNPPENLFPGVRFDPALQEALMRRVSAQMGFDFDAGNLFVQEHPQETRIGPGDVRISTRYDEDLPFSSLLLGMHETGHGMYDQGLVQEWYGTPVGDPCTTAVHEAESLFHQNRIGRSREFWSYLLPIFLQNYGLAPDLVTVDQVYASVNRVAPTLIRVDADELTYPLHVIIRFEIERDLIAGTLAVSDVKEVWNQKYKDYLGLDVPDDVNGVLQDIHWAINLVGYFPAYALGHLNASQLYAAMERDIPDLKQQIAAGDFSGNHAWHHDHIYQYDSLYDSSGLIARATGSPPGIEAFEDYMTAKYTELYNLP